MADGIKIVEENIRPYINHFYVDYLKLPDREIVVLLALKSFAWNHKDNCYPSIATIAQRIDKSERRVTEILGILEEKGLIRIERKEGISNIYYITNKPLDQEMDCTPLTKTSPHPCRKRHPTPDENVTLSNISNIKKNNVLFCSSGDEPDIERQLFEQFWLCNPRKQGKEKAWRIWKRDKLYKIADQIIGDVKLRYDKYWKFKEKEFIPLPATYLNGKQWNDELIEPVIKSSKPPIKDNYHDKLIEAGRNISRRQTGDGSLF
jgi:DNA-binding transcriptional ArsR family regulator